MVKRLRNFGYKGIRIKFNRQIVNTGLQLQMLIKVFVAILKIDDPGESAYETGKGADYYFLWGLIFENVHLIFWQMQTSS